MGNLCIRCQGSGKEPPLPIAEHEYLRIVVDRIVQDYCTAGHVDAPGMVEQLVAAVTVNEPQSAHDEPTTLF
jgi:hypothetical protein